MLNAQLIDQVSHSESLLNNLIDLHLYIGQLFPYCVVHNVYLRSFNFAPEPVLLEHFEISFSPGVGAQLPLAFLVFSLLKDKYFKMKSFLQIIQELDEENCLSIMTLSLDIILLLLI